jgi:hypothetical protein
VNRSGETSAALTEILSNGAQGWAQDVQLRDVGDHYCVELPRIDTRAHGRPRTPVVYGRVVSVVSCGQPFTDTHACLLLSSRPLRGILELGAEIGDTVAVQVVALTDAGRPRYRYGVRHPDGSEGRW